MSENQWGLVVFGAVVCGGVLGSLIALVAGWVQDWRDNR